MVSGWVKYTVELYKLLKSSRPLSLLSRQKRVAVLLGVVFVLGVDC